MVFGSTLRGLNRLTGVEETADAVTATIAMLLAHVIMLKAIDRGPWSYAWLDRGAARPRVLGLGFALGALPIGLASLALLGIGWMAVVPGGEGSWLAAGAKVSFVLLFAALFEEMFSRGYMLAALADGIGMPAAVVATSGLFGLLHIPNTGDTAQAIGLVMLAGVFLSAVLLVTRSLYAAWAAHFAWNWVMAVPLHVAVSGESLPMPGYVLTDNGPDWATGGAWGPEGGAFAGLAMLAALAVLYALHARAGRMPALHSTETT